MNARATPSDGQTYTQILKSTALIGGSSLITVAFSIIRNKAMAVILGPEGVGLMAIYSSIADIAQAVAGLGVQSSGVRQIAEAVGTGDAEKIARTAFILQRISIVLGIAGTLLLACLAFPVAHLTFGDHQHAASVAFLSLAIFFRLASAGQTAMIQGMREISVLARINLLTAVFATVVTIPLVYFFGFEGVAPSLVAIAAVTLLISWWYSRKMPQSAGKVSAPQFRQELGGLLKLGLVFMASGLLTLATAYIVRIIVLQHGGIVAAGLYQSAWALGSLYAGFILQAMGTDFYPRLTAIAGDHTACNRLVNEQAQVSIPACRSGRAGNANLCASRHAAVLFSGILWCCRPLALDLPWHAPAHHCLAHGLHRAGKGRTGDLLLDGSCRDRGAYRSRLVAGGRVRPCGFCGCIFRALPLAQHPHLLLRAQTHRFPLVSRQS